MKRYISDLHIGHKNVIEFDSRPFFNLEEMHKVIVENWNNVVDKNDEVYLIGDVIWNNEVGIKILKQLKGKKYLILGNHDKINAELRKQFFDIKDYKEITDNQRHVIMCHYPILLYKGSYNPDCYMLCGHVHTTRENDFLNKWRTELRESKHERGDNCGNIYNVGCMLPYMGYTPRTLDEIIERSKI
jgi:calcineurin-like phosphoesterase family protein